MSIHTAADVFAQRLPVPVKRIQAHLARTADLWDLPAKALRLLQILTAYTPLTTPDQPIRFNRAKPATLLGVSLRTIDRCLATLVERGMITRVAQKRHGPGKWDCTAICWTPVVVNALFTAQASPTLQKSRNGPDGNFARHGATKLAHKSNPSTIVEVGNKPSDEGCVPQKPEKQTLAQRLSNLMPRTPIDLIQPALDLQLNRCQIATLMAKCRSINQRLQDVFDLYCPSLQHQGLRGRDAMGWLIRVIEAGHDFAFMVKQVEHNQQQQQRELRRQQFQQTVIAALHKHPGLTLPNGSSIAELTDTHVWLNDGGMTNTLPLMQFTRRLIAQSPGFVKNLLRGQIPDAAPPARPALPDGENTQIPAMSDREPDKQLARSQLDQIRALLRPRARVLG
jgi:hypothetical protein